MVHDQIVFVKSCSWKPGGFVTIFHYQLVCAIAPVGPDNFDHPLYSGA